MATAKKEEKKTRGNMTTENIKYMVENWDSETVEELAKKFDVAVTTVSNMAALVRKKSGGKKCRTKRVTKVDMVEDVLKDLGIDIIEEKKE